MARTTTTVHSEDLLIVQRASARMRDQAMMSGVMLYTQLTLGTSMFMLSHVATPSYLAVLMTLPLSIGVALFSKCLSDRTPEGVSVTRALLPGALSSAASILFALSLMIDAQIVLYCFCAIVSHILPESSLIRIAITAALAVPLATFRGDESALGRTAGFLGAAMLIVILISILTALPYGDVGHLFPLLGEGFGSIMTGFAWLSGASACCAVPFLLPTNRHSLNILKERTRPRIGVTALAVCVGAVSALVRAFLLPYYALARPETLGWRIMLVQTISPSIAGWSTYLIGMVFLLLIAFTAAVTSASAFLRDAFRKKKLGASLTSGLLALATVPLAVLNLKEGQNALIDIAPYRLALTLLPMLLCGAWAMWGKRKGGQA